MKTTRRRSRQQAPSTPDPDSARAALSGAGKMPDVNAYVIRAAKSPYGPRPRWGPVEYAQGAIAALHPHGIPRNINVSALTRRVNDHLKQDPGYCGTGLGKVSRQTILRALELLQETDEHAHERRREAERLREARRLREADE